MRTRYIFFILLLGVLACATEAKKESPRDLLTHQWKIDDWIVAPSMGMPDSVKNEMIKTATMEFKADSTFIFKGMNEKPTKGTFSLSDDVQLLTLHPDGANQTYGHAVKELTKNKLVLVDPTGNKLICSH